ncbi:MAG: RraA family protein [Desulfovibrio sp.]|jgi:regulator of RNase E activity RraA|nr:RraA family protein [Desulfovibrio sp.]
MYIGAITRTSPEIIKGFQNLLDKHDSVTCAVSDCLGRYNAMTGDMRPLFPGIRLTGTAVTVKTLASDLGAVFKAIDLCRPGDIIVVDARGSLNTAFWGENMTLSAINQGVLAAVIDGAVRDVEEIIKIGFPVLSKGIVPNVAAVVAYGHVNVTVQCAGVSVSPGDAVIIDGNGVVVVPREDAQDILDKTRMLMGRERLITEKLQNEKTTIGRLVNIDRIATANFDYQILATEQEG